ncbi:hypothetical protein [Deinococcus aluminii]|uniref:TrbL/VirB6 plasmid conjugal transfer protein n=1 Tax=Deinococcus aluminii TaxID=1656885 RepID=A0ABP9XHF5_9DEIO
MTRRLRSALALAVLVLPLLGTAGAQGALEVNLADYVQNPRVWMDTLAADIGKQHLIQSLALFGTYIAGGMGLYTIVWKGILRNNWGVATLTLFKILAVIAVMNATRAGNGPVWAAIDASTQGWTALYSTASNLASPLIKSAVEQGTADMANAAHEYLMAAGAASGIAEVITTAQWQHPNNPLDDTTVQSLVTAEMQARQPTPLDRVSWIVQLGYLLVLGFFALFTAIILGSGFSLILTTLLLPLGVVAWGIGDGRMLKYLLMGVIGAWLTVAVTPFVMVLSAKIAVQYPQQVLTQQIKGKTADLNALAYQYRDEMVKCMSGVTGTGNELGVPKWLGGDYACSGIKAFFIQINAGLQSFWNMVRGFILFIIAMVIAQGIAAYQLRRVPGLLASALGTGIDMTVYGMRTAGVGTVARLTGGAARSMAGPAGNLATTGGRALVGGANAAAGGMRDIGRNATDSYRTARLAGELNRTARNAPGPSGRETYSNAAARMHPSGGRQTGPAQPYNGNTGNPGSARGTTADLGSKNGGKKN